MLLVNRKPEVEQFQLSIVAIQKVSASGAVLACTSHVLSEAVQGGAFLGIAFGIIAVGILDVVFERMYPVDLVGGLERHGYHGDLRHDGAGLSARGGVVDRMGRSLQGRTAVVCAAGSESTASAQPRSVWRETRRTNIIPASRIVREAVAGRRC